MLEAASTTGWLHTSDTPPAEADGATWCAVGTRLFPLHDQMHGLKQIIVQHSSFYLPTFYR